MNFLSEEFNYDKVDDIVDNFFKANPHSWPCWAFSNHDSTRIASRSLQTPKELMAKLLSLKGNVCIYQGEELGLHESELDFVIFVIHLGKGFGQSLKEEMVVEPLCPGFQLTKTWVFLKQSLGYQLIFVLEI